MRGQRFLGVAGDRGPLHRRGEALPLSLLSGAPHTDRTRWRPRTAHAGRCLGRWRDARAMPGSADACPTAVGTSSGRPPTRPVVVVSYGAAVVLPDRLLPGLLVVFVGTSVGIESAARQHYFADPKNSFWTLLDAVGLTGHAGLTSEDDETLPSYGIGLTDLVKGRAASSNALLASTDYDAAGFVARIETYQPKIVAFHDLAAITHVARYLTARPLRPSIGPLPWRVAGAQAYRLPSSSGTNAHMTAEQKTTAWREFGAWARRQNPTTDAS